MVDPQTQKAIGTIDNAGPVIAFHIARSRAIDAYASLERTLAELYASLMGVGIGVAAVSFFKINNTRVRNTILEELLKKKHGQMHNYFWNSLLGDFLRPLDEKRNQIVHWTLHVDLRGHGQDIELSTDVSTDELIGALVLSFADLLRTAEPDKATVTLVPPNWYDKQNTPAVTQDDLEAFKAKAAFTTRLTMQFIGVLIGNPSHPKWREICEKPIPYPPPDNHPLSQIL